MPASGNLTILDHDSGILAHEYEFTKGARSIAFIARMESGELLVVSPSTGLTDELAAKVREYGEVGAIVANNGLHYLGQSEWRARFPEARCFAAPETAKRVKKKSKETLEFEPLSELQPLLGPGLLVREVPNTRFGETWCSAATADGGHIWYASDVLANLRALPKAFVPRTLFKMTRSAPAYSVFHLSLKFACKDRNETLQLMLDDMESRPPSTVVPAHGEILTEDGLPARTRELIEAAL